MGFPGFGGPGVSETCVDFPPKGSPELKLKSQSYKKPSQDTETRLLAELCEGDVKRGRVTNLCSFGAFVDLGGAEGLIHISEMSWGRVKHPGDVLQTGHEVEVYVINVDREGRKIGLSLKRLQPDPWTTVAERYQVGQLVEGTITNVVSFGAFARVEEGLYFLSPDSPAADAGVDVGLPFEGNAPDLGWQERGGEDAAPTYPPFLIDGEDDEAEILYLWGKTDAYSP